MKTALITVEWLENAYCVVFYPFKDCPIESAMLLSTHTKAEFAERYRQQFIDTLKECKTC